MRTILLILTFITVFTVVNAQNTMQGNKAVTKQDSSKMNKKLSFSIGLEEGIPVNYVAKYASFVTGGSVQAEYRIIKELGITLNAGVIYFLAKDGEKGLSFIPVMAGLRYNILPKVYLSGQLGTSFYVGKDSNHTQYLTYAQGIGFQISKQVDILAKYEGVNTQAERTYSFAGLRVAYALNKRK